MKYNAAILVMCLISSAAVAAPSDNAPNPAPASPKVCKFMSLDYSEGATICAMHAIVDVCDNGKWTHTDNNDQYCKVGLTDK
jgi:hypothetical protein